MQTYSLSELQANPSAVFHQADIDAVFVDFDGHRYEIRQVKAVSKSPLNIAGLAEFHKSLRNAPPLPLTIFLMIFRQGANGVKKGDSIEPTRNRRKYKAKIS